MLVVWSVSAALGLVLWRRGELLHDPARRLRPKPVVASTAVAPSTVAEAEEPAPDAISPDSGLAPENAGYGVLLPQGNDSVASFFVVTLHDSSTSLEALGFIRAANLLDTAARFEPYGDSPRLPRFRVASPGAVDSAFRARDDGCILEVPVSARPSLPPASSWVLALAPGEAEVLPSAVWRISGDTMAQRGEALRLAGSLPADTVNLARGLEPVRAMLAAAPLQIVTHYRFVADGAEILIVETHRASTSPPDSSSGGGPVLEEQRLLIAERSASDKSSPFRVVWHHVNVDDPDQLVTETPLAMVRLGQARVLTLFTDGHYRDGGGGLFVARVGRGKWRTVASWYTGC